jgi:tetratricopeptide (TPR) repeat protein
VQTRTKSVARFAEELLRDDGRLTDAVHQLRDLCGGRLVVHTPEEVRSVAAFLDRYFDLDAASFPGSDRHATASPPGFSSVTRVVRLDRARAEALAFAFGVEIPEDVYGLWAEVQVRTSLQNAWLEATEEMRRDIPLLPPQKWTGELGDIARVMQALERAFARIRTGFAAYRTSYPSYLTKKEIEREIELLERVLEWEADPAVAARLGKLAIANGDFDRAIRVLEPHAAANYQPALRDLGVALCQKHRTETASPDYERGQRLLKMATEPPHRDVDALASLAGTWKRRGEEETALALYRRAFEIDSADPYALGGVLESELVLHPEVDIVTALRGEVDASIERCREHIEARVNLPWAFYSLGRFRLLIGDVEKGLDAVEQAIAHSTTRFMIQTTLESYERLAACHQRFPGLGQARDRLAAALREWTQPQ